MMMMMMIIMIIIIINNNKDDDDISKMLNLIHSKRAMISNLNISI